MIVNSCFKLIGTQPCAVALAAAVLACICG